MDVDNTWILNPYTGRYIKKNKRVYNTLLKAGIILGSKGDKTKVKDTNENDNTKNTKSSKFILIDAKQLSEVAQNKI